MKNKSKEDKRLDDVANKLIKLSQSAKKIENRIRLIL
jgi:hypothetical protein